MLNKYTIFQPNITEKSFALAATGKYTFLVSKGATKGSVTEGIEKYFKVKVLDVNIIHIPGKVKRTKTGLGKRKNIVKAIVTLKKGDRIDIFDAEEEKDAKQVKVTEKSNKKSKTTSKEQDLSKDK